MIKEYKQKIWEFYPFRIELHTHTAPASPCSSFSAKALAEALAREGIHAAVLTNHFSDGDHVTTWRIGDIYEAKSM